MRVGGSGVHAVVSKMVSGALVVQALKKCQSLSTSKSLFHMLLLLLLGEWDELLKLDSGLVSASLAQKVQESNEHRA
jgi:hypothetical protein